MPLSRLSTLTPDISRPPATQTPLASTRSYKLQRKEKVTFLEILYTNSRRTSHLSGAKRVSTLHHSPLLVCKCRVMVRKLSNEPLLCELQTPLTPPFDRWKGQLLQSGKARESLKVSPTLDRTAAAAAMFLFWSQDWTQPMGRERCWAVIAVVITCSDSRGRCCVTDRYEDLLESLQHLLDVVVYRYGAHFNCTVVNLNL